MIRKDIHTDDIQDIIGNPPHGLIRWGITWVAIVLFGVVALASIIRYPDVVKTTVRINAANAPKSVVSRVAGNMVDILVEENERVAEGQLLGFMESTADHRQVLQLLDHLYILRDRLYNSLDTSYRYVAFNFKFTGSLEAPARFKFGELQSSYQAFYQSYLTYQAATGMGIYLKRREYILRDINNVKQQRAQLERQRVLQEREYELAEMKFKRNEGLAVQNVISPAEFEEHQATLLARQHPLMQTESALLTNEANHSSKVKELADLDNQIVEERSKFMQALNSLISETEQWKQQFVLSSHQTGTVVYAGILQRGQYVSMGQEVFLINPGSTDFFAEVNIPQYNMGKVQQGQEVLVKLNSYPFEEYDVLKGRIEKLSEVPHGDSIFLSRVKLDTIAPHRNIRLNTGMLGTAEIITEDASLLQRLLRNLRIVMDQRR